MRKKILLGVLLILNIFLLKAQDSTIKFWDALLKNDRVLAEKILNKEKQETIEYVITNEIFREEIGQFVEHPEFLTSFLIKPEFENYLYCLWNKSFVFDNYIEIGLNNRNKQAIETVANTLIKNQDLFDAFKYLKSIKSREKGDWNSYFALNESLPAIKNWQYCGVFENLNGSGLDKFYEPEVKAISKEPFDAKSNGFVNWYKNSNTKESYQFFTNHESYGSGVNYAQTFLYSPINQRVIIRIGSGSAFKLWLNDVLIYQNTEDVSTDLNGYKVAVTIPKGENRLLLKCADKTSDGYFITSILNEDGSPNTNITNSSEYKSYNTIALSELNPEILENSFELFFKNKVKENPNNFFNTYCLASTFLRNSKYEAAKEVLEPFINKYPKSSLLRKLQIQIYLLAGDTTTFNEIKKNIELDDPDYYLPFVFKVVEFTDLNRMTLPELKIFLNKFKSTVNNETLAFTADYIYNARSENMTVLKENLNNILSISSENVNMLLRCAPIFGQVFNEDEKTISILEDINNKFFDYSGIQTLSRYYDNKKEKEKSLKILSKDFDNLVSDNTYITPIIEKLHNYKKYEESLSYINKALDNFPYAYEILELKGDALLKLDDKEGAILAYENSLKHDSSNSNLRKKIKDLKNEPNILNDIILSDVYKVIELNRGKISSNNYGYNILNEDYNLELYNEGGGKYRYINIYEITSNSGLEIFKEYNLGLTGRYHIIKSEIVKPGGSIVPADKSGSNLVFNGLAIGDVVYIDYEGSFSSYGRFYKDYTDDFQFDSFHPLVKYSLKIITPKNYKLFYKGINGALEPKITTTDSYNLYKWQVENLPGKPQEEDYMPDAVDLFSYLHLSTIPDWNEISLWYSDLVRSSIEVDSRVKDVFNTLFPNGYKQLNDEEKARIIYNYIKNNFTYSHVDFKQSGYVPQKPSKTIKTNLGDCKDFSTLFVTLASMVELKSNLVLILTADYGRNSLILPSTDFNHCIVKVYLNGQERFLELTDKYLPFNSLPTSLRGATGLEIPFNPDSNKKFDLIKLDNVLRNPSIFKNNVQLKITENDIKMTIDTEFSGHVNSYYASMVDDPNPEVVKKSVYDELKAQISEDFTLDELSNVERINNDSLVKYTSKITLNKKINKIGSIKILQLPIVSKPYTSDIVSLDTRTYPIEYWQYENVDEYFNTYDLLIDSPMEFIEIPKDQKLKFKEHFYEITYLKLKENHLQIKVHAKPSLKTVSIEEYNEFKAYVTSILDAQKEFIGFK